MKMGDRAELKIKKMLQFKTEMKQQTFEGEVLRLDEKNECIYMTVEKEELSKISLDCIYECDVYADKTRIKCTGRIKERYIGENGATVKFLIENGFYKINIKSVDKQIV